jgi:small subunit ribosomal protein S8
MTDPIADMLTRIRNANMVYHEKVDIPASRIKLQIAKILKDEGFIKDYKFIPDKKQGILRIYMRYGENKERMINYIERVSKPGRRVYVGYRNIPKVLEGDGIAILSTSKGILKDKDCKRLKIGGELLCYVW